MLCLAASVQAQLGSGGPNGRQCRSPADPQSPPLTPSFRRGPAGDSPAGPGLRGFL